MEKEQIKNLASEWALKNSDATMETNSALNKGFIGGFEACLSLINEDKLIELDQYERQWIKFCKLHYKDKYFDLKGSWVNMLKPLFIEHYGYNPDEDNNYHDYLNCIFNKLLQVYHKIKDTTYPEQNEREMRDIFEASFYKRPSREDELPIERAISMLCGLIQGNQVIENGVERYSLEEN